MATNNHPICVDLTGELLRGCKESYEQYPPITVPQLFINTAREYDNFTALNYKNEKTKQ